MPNLARRFALVATACSLLLPAQASADALMPGQILSVAFDFDSSIPFPFGVPDMLWGRININRIEPFGTVTTNLFDLVRGALPRPLLRAPITPLEA